MMMIEVLDPPPAMTHTKTAFSGTLEEARVKADRLHHETGRRTIVTINHSVYYTA